MNLQEQTIRIKQMMGILSEEKQSGEKWIKCRNCNKKYTQTIHKGKKSLLVCPHCGTHELEEDIIKENDDLQTQLDLLVDFEMILNRKMPKKFPWWKELDLESIGYNHKMDQISVYGNLTVDEDWARNQFKTLHPPPLHFPGANYLEFNDLLTTDEWTEVKRNSAKYYTFLTGQNADRITMNRLNIRFDSPQSQKMEHNEAEITEKCWPGYTQKGMKTMFGKRYPNCVKKSKK